ncbi:CENP-Q, a CENPA-CAD centromere complex subunit-domain-containing protein [Cadophora sp. MPI-SDFR-AT-0126]|nr:CENP-Q, a CENPA-CAD centromere complex subunit-domain-containing protein [Leotiomycetes sp. MPI-SDFR-AT-0126]
MEMPLRRGRSSAGEAELRTLGVALQAVEMDRTEGKRERKRGEPTPGRAEEQVNTKRRGRPAARRDEEQIDELLGEQAKDTTASKRRRRRSVGAVDDQSEDKSVTEDSTEWVSSKKRGRRPREPSGEGAEEHLPKGNKKRGRPAASETAAEIVPEVPEPRKRHTRQSDAKVIEQEADSVPIESTPARGRTRLRRTDVLEQEVLHPKRQEPERKRTRRSEIQAEVEDVEAGGGTRTKRSDTGSQQHISDSVVQSSRKLTMSNRRSEVVAVETATSRLTRAPGRKPSKPSSNTSTAKKISSSTQTSTKGKRPARVSSISSIAASSQTHKKSSKRNSQVEAPSRKRKGVENTEVASSKRQRIETVPEQDQIDAVEVDLLNYQHLKAVTRNVSRQTIEAKWEALPPTAIDRIAQLLSDLQRPVIACLSDERKKTQASTAVEVVSRKLVKKFSRGLPFPPGTRNHREDDFDFEKILDHNRALEAQLTPALHSSQLLEAELSKELAKLEADKEFLAELETNAKAEALVRNQAARKLHSVLKEDDSIGGIELLKDDIGLQVDRQFPVLDLGVQDDENLRPLMEELGDHVDSIQGNIKQVQGISQAMAKSRAAVQATLFDHLDNSLYDDVMLGAEERV